MTHPGYCSRVYEKFFEPGEVTEIRAFGLDGRGKRVWEGFAGGGIVSGYFDNAADFGRCAAALDRAKAEGVYFVLNPVEPALLARAANRLKGFNKKMKLTSDKEVKCLRWLLVDLDPKRPAGISSDDVELGKARDLLGHVKAWLVKEGFVKATETVEAMSGNGYHLLCRTHDWPNDEAHVNFRRDALAAIEDEFIEFPGVEIDQVTFNPSRLCKVYSTVARKGDHVEDRPHRRSFLAEWKDRGGG